MSYKTPHVFHQLTTILLIFLLSSIIHFKVSAQFNPTVTPTPTKSPDDYVKKDIILFDLKAPWPAGIVFHLGGDGNYYDKKSHKNTTNGGRDKYALDFNGDTSKLEPKIDDGSIVLAVADGIVKKVEYKSGYCPEHCNYGHNIVIVHPGGLESLYAHLRDTPLVKEGDWVFQGTPLGYIGESGCCGEHLHFAMYYCDPNLSEAECEKSENRYAVIPEPLEEESDLVERQRIKSSNYGVGYEAIPQDDIYDLAKYNKFLHNEFQSTYRFFGGQNEYFGATSTPVQKFSGTDYSYQEFLANKNPFSPAYKLESAIFFDGNMAYFMVGPIWYTYITNGGPNSELGLPITHSYLWGSTLFSTRPGGFRTDFENGSITWDTTTKIEILKKDNTKWETSIYRLPNFSDLALIRRDKNINLSWTPVASTGTFRNDVQLGASFTSKASVDVGLVSIYQIVAEYQGTIEIISDGKMVLSGSSPNKTITQKSTSIKTGKTNLEVRFSQTPLMDAKVKITAQGLGISHPVYAAEDYFISMEAIQEAPIPSYIGFEPPPYPDTGNIPPPAPTGTSSTVLVFDTSGSMNDPDSSGQAKIDAARKAGTQILNIISAENSALGSSNQIGMVGYSTTPYVVSQLTADINSLFPMVDSLIPTNRTGMADGLKTGMDLFGSAQDKKVLILLSDGLPNVGLYTDEHLDITPIKQQILDLATQAGQNSICIYTVGFGDPNIGFDSIDEGFLAEVANASGCGTYYNATNAIELANVYVELRHTSTGNIVFKQSGQISQGQQLDLGQVEIPANQELMLLTLNWPGSRLQAVIKDPSGKIVDANYKGAVISESSTLMSIILENPKAGSWSLGVIGVEVPEGTTVYNTIISTRAGAAVTPTTGSGAMPVVIIFILLAGSAIGVYVYSNSIKRSGKGVVTGSSTGGRLVGIDGEYANRTIVLQDGMIIGRGSGCGIRLSDPSVSRWHARVRFAQNAWFIQDQGSKGGTFINGQRVNASRLANDDTIQIGNNLFRFLDEGK